MEAVYKISRDNSEFLKKPFKRSCESISVIDCHDTIWKGIKRYLH